VALRIVFMGTPELACASLQELAARKDFEIVAVVTQPDRAKGRELRVQPSPVKRLALELSFPVLQPERARNPDFAQALRTLNPDLVAVTAYGQILPREILDIPRFGCLNVHTSLLPKYRGAAPIQWAILDGELETGVTIMKMDSGLDSGPIVAQEKTAINAEDDSQTLHDRLAVIGGRLLARTIPEYVAGRLLPNPQPAEGVRPAPKIKKEDGRIDWKQPARAIWNRIRAFRPWPGAYTQVRNSGSVSVLKVWRGEALPGSGTPGEIISSGKDGIVVACGSGAFRILELQREGGRRLTALEFLTGHTLQTGQQLG
jgi:methionyl-tRNA formyltransferase